MSDGGNLQCRHVAVSLAFTTDASRGSAGSFTKPVFDR
jgi:hypothetical protein